MFTYSRSLWQPMLPAFLLLLVSGVYVAQATTVEKMSFSAVVDGAQIIVVGAVTDIEYTWDADQQLPFTEVTFSVRDVLKGDVRGAELTLQFLGGPQPDGLTLEVAGMPHFEIGDRTVVFAADNGVYSCPLVGWWQGLYRLLFDLQAMDWVVADHEERPVAAIDRVAGRLEVRLWAQTSDQTIADTFTLDEFTASVRAAARQNSDVSP